MPNDVINSPHSVPTGVDRDHSACGVGMIANVEGDASHQVVVDGLKMLADFDYRSGYNWATEESDGAGIRFYGLAPSFFMKKIAEKEFLSSKGEPITELTRYLGKRA